jgi:hypothetical protein
VTNSAFSRFVVVGLEDGFGLACRYTKRSNLVDLPTCSTLRWREWLESSDGNVIEREPEVERICGGVKTKSKLECSFRD